MLFKQGDHKILKAIYQPFWAKAGVFQLFLAQKYIFFQPLVIKK